MMPVTLEECRAAIEQGLTALLKEVGRLPYGDDESYLMIHETIDQVLDGLIRRDAEQSLNHPEP